jgi:RNase P subunit RPR2
MTTNAERTTCKSWEHAFVPKKQMAFGGAGGFDTTEVYCQKCGTVCILSTQPEPKIELARLS